MKRRLALLVLAVALLSGCGHWKGPGVVMGKGTNPEHEEFRQTMLCAAWGKYGCIVWVPYSWTEHVDTEYWVVVLGDKDKKRHPVYLQRSEWSTMHEGDHVVIR